MILVGHRAAIREPLDIPYSEFLDLSDTPLGFD
jgi:hypothetical protein